MEVNNIRISVYSAEYSRYERAQGQVQADQNVIMREEYHVANRDYVRTDDRALQLRDCMMERYLMHELEYKRLTSYPQHVFLAILHHAVTVEESIAQIIEQLLQDKDLDNYPPSWALMETMHYLVAGTTYKENANMFLTGQYRMTKAIRITIRGLANTLPVPTVS